MRLDKNICLGGRLNNKDIIGIKYNGYEIYKNIFYTPYEFRDGSMTEVTTMVNDSHTNLSYMFYNCNNLTTINGIKQWDTSNVTTMNNMFSYSGLTELDLSSFDTHNVIDMTKMFCACSYLTSLNLSSFDTSNVTDMDQMFANCVRLTELDLSSFDTSNVVAMNQMFAQCRNLKKLNLSIFDMTNVSSSETYQMFQNNRLEELRLDNCNTNTIKKIINYEDTYLTTDGSYSDGITRKIYVNPDNVGDLTPPINWVFVNCFTDEIIS